MKLESFSQKKKKKFQFILIEGTISVTKIYSLMQNIKNK